MDASEVIEAANKLQGIARDPTCKNLAKDAGCIKHIVALLQHGIPIEVSEAAIGALANLARGSDANKDAIRDAKGVAPLITMLSVIEHPDDADELLETM